jgi:hypothetical protein
MPDTNNTADNKEDVVNKPSTCEITRIELPQFVDGIDLQLLMLENYLRVCKGSSALRYSN